MHAPCAFDYPLGTERWSRQTRPSVKESKRTHPVLLAVLVVCSVALGGEKGGLLCTRSACPTFSGQWPYRQLHATMSWLCCAWWIVAWASGGLANVPSSCGCPCNRCRRAGESKSVCACDCVDTSVWQCVCAYMYEPSCRYVYMRRNPLQDRGRIQHCMKVDEVPEKSSTLITIPQKDIPV